MTKVNAIRILTAIEGKTTDFFAAAEGVCEGETLTARYAVDGDRGTVEIGAKEFAMERRGQLGLSARFRPGEVTEFGTVILGHTAKIPVRTDLYRVGYFPSEVCVTLGYALLFPKEIQHVELAITVKTEEV